jgi:predicted Zn finger-like uncharacterized protein
VLEIGPRPKLMDVRCERCQTEYEVEDSIVSDLGTEVQCSDCGHQFTVKRPPTSAVALPVVSENRTDKPWTLMTTLGQNHELRDLTQLHKWIIEKRVTRQDQISQDGVVWQTLGSMTDLVPFFDIVDSADHARSLDTLPVVPVVPLAPLQPPILTPHEVRLPGETRKPTPASGQLASPYAAGDSLGALPQASDPGETTMIRAKSASRRLMKVGLMVVIAAAIGSGGILWQRHYLRSAVISSAGNTEAPAAQANAVAAAVPPPIIPPIIVPSQVAAKVQVREVAEAGGSVDGEPASAQAGDKSVPQTAAARGYVALNHHEYAQAVALFKEALAERPTNGTALFGLAEAYRGAGQKAHALQTYRRYVKGLPWGPDAHAARAHIRALESQKH